MSRGLHLSPTLRGSARPALRASPILSPTSALYQTRSIWWWQRQRADCTPHHDDSLEERLRIYQRFLRHRSSKMLRRRAMWDRDAMAPASSWPWRMPAPLIGRHLQKVQNLSSTTTAKARVQDHNNEPGRHRPSATFHRDFESFKKAVDEAIQKDPYGALFGRRLQGPDSANNSSWTSFSWIWDPKEIKQDRPDSQPVSETAEQTARPPPPPTSTASPHTDAPSKASPSSSPSPEPGATSIPSKQGEAEEEYEYDPISMRRIPKSKRNRLLSLFFCEHDLDLTPKLYEPKVYGYADKSKESTSSHPVAASDTNELLESSRRHHLRDLRAAALGNTIGTSAEFGGKFSPPDSSPQPPESSPGPRKRKQREESEPPSDDAPLFSGTTYEGKLVELLASRRSVANSGLPPAEPNPNADGGSDIPVNKFDPRIQPSLDRLISTKEAAQTSVLQPALDRHLQTRGPDSSRAVLDLASDNTVEDVDTGTSKRPSKSSPAWKHVERHPDGIVAKTIKTLGLTYADTASPENSGLFDVKANLHEDIVQGANRALTQEAASGLIRTAEDNYSNQGPDAGRALHPLRTASVKPGVARSPAVDAHISDFEPRFARLVDGAKDVKREIYDVHIRFQQLKNQIVGVSDPVPEKAVERPSFTMLKDDPVEQHIPETLDPPLSPAAHGVNSTSDPVSWSAEEPVSLTVDASRSDHEQASSSSILVDPKSLSTPYVLLRYNSSKDIVDLVPMSETPVNDESSLDSFNRLDHAARFFSFFPVLLKQGYEVASGGQDYVLFKQGNPSNRASINEAVSPSETPLAPSPKLVKPPMSPAAAARLKEHQGLTTTYIKLDDVKHSHGLNSFEVHSVLSKLAASVRTGKQEGAEGLSGVLGKLKILRSKALTMDPTEFKKQADELIREVQVARAAVPIKQVTPVTPISGDETQPSEAQKMYAATVLNEIPMPIPIPGPSAPTAPPSNPAAQPIQKQPTGSTSVPLTTPPFSEAQTTELEPRASQQPRAHLHPRLAPSSAADRLDESEQGHTEARWEPLPSHEKSNSEAKARAADEPTKTSALRRFTRLVRKTILTTIAAGTGAYVIGLIAESVGAETQKAKAGEDGPRKKVVLPASRPGIFSTESSR
ncbi:hypothetical protein DV735_g3461, partial [Chaetothyriales sp. CBS 134920]